MGQLPVLHPEKTVMQPLLAAEKRGLALEAEDARPARWKLDRFSWWILLIGFLLTAGISIAHRYTMSPDTLSYLEVGESWLRFDFPNGINGYWNPLYSILTAATAKLSGQRQFEPVGPHLLNIALYAGAVFAFLGLVRALFSEVERRGRDISEQKGIFLPIASALFVWATIYMMDPAYSMPDLLVLIWVLLAANAWLRVREEGIGAAAVFGLFLGLGYLTKAVMFPLGVIFLAASLIPTSGDWKLEKSLRNTSIAAGVFLAVCALYILPLSFQKGRFSFSDSGPLAYAWEVNGISPYFHWQGQEKGSGTPLHPTRQILDWPPTFEFDGPRPGTYSPWFDPSYWNDGLRGHFRLSDQLKRLKASARFYANFFVHTPVPILFAITLLVGIIASGWRNFLREILGYSNLLLPCGGAFGLYALVFVTPRYLAPFALLGGILLAWPCLCREGSSELSKRITTVFAVLTLLFTALFSFKSMAREIVHPNVRSYRMHRRVVEQLTAFGVNTNDKVAVIGTGCEAYYARLAGVRIVAETLVFPGHPQWPVNSENLAKIVRAIAAKTSAKAVVLDVEPLEFDLAWVHVPGTPYRILRINGE